MLVQHTHVLDLRTVETLRIAIEADGEHAGDADDAAFVSHNKPAARVVVGPRHEAVQEPLRFALPAEDATLDLAPLRDVVLSERGEFVAVGECHVTRHPLVEPHGDIALLRLVRRIAAAAEECSGGGPAAVNNRTCCDDLLSGIAHRTLPRLHAT